MYKVGVILIVVFLLGACDENFKAPKPDNFIEQAVMEDILYDVKLISAARSKSFKKTKDSNLKADKYIYHKYKIDSITFKQNLDYYATTSFKRFKEMEENIKLRFMKEKEVISDELKRADSLKIPKELKPKKMTPKSNKLSDKEKKELFKGKINKPKKLVKPVE